MIETLDFKKYKSLIRYGKPGSDEAIKGNIIIFEKLDGANSSFKIENNEVVSFSRRNILTEELNLQGFYQFVQENIKKELLNKKYIYFGEWLSKHKINYGENQFKFYLFDVYDTENNVYLSFDIVKQEAEKLKVETVPVLYEGQFISIEHIQSFVGQSIINSNGVGEGVVVKNYAYRDKTNSQVFVKFVSNEFREVKERVRHRNTTNSNPLKEFVENTVTESRVEKLILKEIEDGNLPEDFSMQEMGTILKLISNKLYQDIIDEEFHMIEKIIKKQMGKTTPLILKDIINKK